jgi:DNA primase
LISSPKNVHRPDVTFKSFVFPKPPKPRKNHELQASLGIDSLRTLILDAVSSDAALEPEVLKNHLVTRGFGDVLDQLETQAKHLNEWFLGPQAAPDDARTGLRQMIALHRKTVTLDRELKAAEIAFANDPTEENLNALSAVREELHSSLGSEALIQGFGAASGRNSDPTS